MDGIGSGWSTASAFGGHRDLGLLTGFPPARRYALRRAPAVNYREETVAMNDGGEVILDWLEARNSP